MTAPTPPLVSFSAGQVPDAQDMNALPANINTLYNQIMGGFRIRRPMCAMRLTKENAEVAGGTNFKINLDSIELDTDNLWSGISDELITFATPGVYRIYLQVMVVQSTLAAASTINALLIKNDSDLANLENTAVGSGTGPLYSGMGAGVIASCVAPFNKGDRIYWVVRHSATETVALDPEFGGTRAFAVWLGPLP